MGQEHWRDWIVYQEPRDMVEALQRKTDLGTDIENIQIQLGDRFREAEAAGVPNGPDYLAWRKKASTALLARKEELRRIKRWIIEHKQTSQPASASGFRRDRYHAYQRLVLRVLRALLCEVYTEDDEIDDANGALVNDIDLLLEAMGDSAAEVAS